MKSEKEKKEGKIGVRSGRGARRTQNVWEGEEQAQRAVGTSEGGEENDLKENGRSVRVCAVYMAVVEYQNPVIFNMTVFEGGFRCHILSL